LEAVSSTAGGPAADSETRRQVPAPETIPDATETNERAHTYRSSEEWRERALRLQAEMATYRRRQRRIAQEDARKEQTALLKDVLGVADNLDRALAAAQQRAHQRVQERPTEQRHDNTLARGVELTRTSLERTLTKHGLERIQAMGEVFDPTWHEAVHTVPAAALGVEPGTVVEVLEAGYRRQGALFRPAKVVVAL
jgi:molecular chaperone GrpE